MPITGFLRIEDIPGESQRADHEDEIDVHDIRWGIERSMPASIGRGRVRSRAKVKPLVVQKYYDAASPYLARTASQGRSFAEATLTLRKDSGESHLDYLTITLENVVISSYEVASNRDDMADLLLEEEIAMDFERATLRYKTMNADGSVGTLHEVEIRD
ncbi:MAG: type VI secretion system tube protein Hcp [Pseudomonadota bacterium]